MRRLTVLAMLLLCAVCVSWATDAALWLDNFTVHQNRAEQREVRVSLPDTVRVISCQFDVLLPEGMTVATGNDPGAVALSVDSARVTHKVISRCAANSLRVVIYSFSAAELPMTHEGGLALLTFDARRCRPGDYEVQLTTVAFSTVNGQSLRLPDTTCRVTVVDTPDSPQLTGNTFMP